MKIFYLSKHTVFTLKAFLYSYTVLFCRLLVFFSGENQMFSFKKLLILVHGE